MPLKKKTKQDEHNLLCVDIESLEVGYTRTHDRIFPYFDLNRSTHGGRP